jgi:hypothetical protein
VFFIYVTSKHKEVFMIAMKKAAVAPSYTVQLMESAEKILDSGYILESQPKNSFLGDPEFSLKAWGRLGFQIPPIIEKQEIFGHGSDSVQEVKVKFVYHEKNDLGFASLIVLSLKLQRNMPVDVTTVPNADIEIRGSKWILTELKHLASPEKKKLVCLSW